MREQSPSEGEEWSNLSFGDRDLSAFFCRARITDEISGLSYEGATLSALTAVCGGDQTIAYLI